MATGEIISSRDLTSAQLDILKAVAIGQYFKMSIGGFFYELRKISGDQARVVSKQRAQPAQAGK